MESNLRRYPDFISPRWCFNGHVHTIACSLAGAKKQPSVERKEIPTPDDDFLEIDCCTEAESTAVVALFHGLEGSTERYYIAQLINTLSASGFSVVAVNFRSCGSRMNNKRGYYHSGETKDYAAVFKWMKRNYPGQKIGAVGFSLGGNALLKYLGEQKKHSLVSAAAAISVPYDLHLCSLLISRGFNRIYEYRFLKSLQKKLEQKRERFPDLPVFDGSTLFEFDDQVTAPIHGFNDAEDYYKRCSSRRFLDDIAIPTLLVHSRKDPICPAAAMPLAKIFKHPMLDYLLTDHGGHVGFWSKSNGWLYYVIDRYLEEKLIR